MLGTASPPEICAVRPDNMKNNMSCRPTRTIRIVPMSAFDCVLLLLTSGCATQYVHDRLGVLYYWHATNQTACVVGAEVRIRTKVCLTDEPIASNSWITPEMKSNMVERVLTLHLDRMQEDILHRLRPAISTSKDLRRCSPPHAVAIPMLNLPWACTPQDECQLFDSTQSQYAVLNNWHGGRFDLMTTPSLHPSQYDCFSSKVGYYQYDVRHDLREGKTWRPLVYPLYVLSIPWDIVTWPVQAVLEYRWYMKHYWK